LRTTKNSWNCTPKDELKLSTVQQTNKPLFRAYLLRETFQNVYAVDLVDEADTYFAEWYGWARRSRLAPFVRVAQTMKEHWQGIRRFIDHKITNAPVEGYNSKARMISHRAFGFHSAKAFIAMLFLCCSGIELSPLGQGRP
jgi:transposase